MVGTLPPSLVELVALPTLRIRNLTKRLSDRKNGMPDQAGILDRGLAMFHCLPVNRITDHFRKCRNAWIFGDEAMVPTLFRRPDQHQFEPALPHDPAAQPFEHRPAFPAIGRIGL